MSEFARPRPPISVIIDTDIADDIDDAVALAFALGSPELDVLGVTVVYGDVETRAKVARKLLHSWGRADIPVKLGFERPLGFEWFPGAEPLPCSQAPAVADGPPLADSSGTAPQFIADCVHRWPGEVHVLTCGAMTNVAAALCAEPALADEMAGVVSGAGEVLPLRHGGPDWNVAYDVTAAEVLARSGARWTVVAWDTFGGAHSLKPSDLAALAGSGLPSAEVLLELIVQMKRDKPGQEPEVRTYRDVKSVSTCDVAVPASLLYADRIDFRSGRVVVQAEAGCLGFVPEDDGPHRWVAAAATVAGFRQEILRRLLSAPRPPGT